MIEIRTSTSAADDARSNEIYNAVWPSYAFANEDAQAFKQAMLVADDHLARLEGALAGSAFTAVRPDRPDTVFALIAVLLHHRGRGVGSALYDAVSRWAATHELATLEGFVDAADARSLEFATTRGFAPVERYERLVLDLAATADLDAEAPEGIEVGIWDGDTDSARGAYAVALEAYRDEPGGEAAVVGDFEDWLERDFHRMAATGAPTFLARSAGEVVGYAQLTVTAARPGVAAHAFTGVRRAWRNRGVAAALKRAQIVWAKANGLDQLVTQNEERNAPMLRINERFGYRPGQARLLVRGRVSGGV